MEKTDQRHEIPPIYDAASRILILGSFPSARSREAAFYYAHPQNRFWRVVCAVLDESLPQTVEEKRALLLRRGIALWDVIASCEICGSADATIDAVVPNDLTKILRTADIRQIFCNGAAAHGWYHRLIRPKLGREALRLPSTSPANAAWSCERLSESWRATILPYLTDRDSSGDAP